MMMQVSNNGIKLTEASEGCKLRAYQDTGGVWTIGYGHTGGVREGQVITQAVADTLLRHDILYAAGVVNEHCLPCTQGQFDALVDFVFNVGPSQFLNSTLFKLHKAGQYDKAAAEFPKWKYDNGKVEPGLVERRAKEQSLYNLQEPVATHPHTDAPVRSVPSAPDPVLAAPAAVSCQPLQVPPVPTSSTVPVSGSKPAALLSQVAESFRKLIAGIGGSKT